jgi:hypothetical protein
VEELPQMRQKEVQAYLRAEEPSTYHKTGEPSRRLHYISVTVQVAMLAMQQGLSSATTALQCQRPASACSDNQATLWPFSGGSGGVPRL